MQIETHKVNGCNDGITITVRDEPGQGGACHLYRIEWDDKKCGPDPQSMRQMQDIHFQEGPILEVGTNGVTHEVLLAIVQHRLEGFQSGKFACEENAAALASIKKAMAYLKIRTENRLARGVEGTHIV